MRAVLQRPLFNRAEILAGREFLDAPVRWVHVGEIPDIATYLRGQELILSTGVGLRQPRDRLRYLEQLSYCKVTGICIEPGRYLHRIPDDMVRRAGQFGLPLIVFHESVRFVDITQDVHALILQNEQHVLEQLHALGEELHGLAALAQPANRIIERLATWLERPAVFLDDRGGMIAAGPPEVVRELERRSRVMLGQMHPNHTIYPDLPFREEGTYVLSRRVGGATPFGLIASTAEGDDRVATGMALDLAAAALGPGLGRERHPGLGWDRAGTSLVRDLLLGRRVPPPDLLGALVRRGTGSGLPAQVVVMRARSPEVDADSLAVSLQDWLASQGVHCLTTPWEGEVAAVILDPPPSTALRGVAQMMAGGRWSSGGAPLQLGFSRRTVLRGLPNALREAEQVLSLCDMRSAPQSPFYEELGALRLLLGLHNDFDLEAFCDDELGAVLKHDRIHGGGMLATLQALLDTPDRSQAAQALRVHRQTLYYRIRRLEVLLGDDFLSPERRLALQLALRARNLVQGR